MHANYRFQLHVAYVRHPFLSHSAAWQIDVLGDTKINLDRSELCSFNLRWRAYTYDSYEYLHAAIASGLQYSAVCNCNGQRVTYSFQG